MTSAESTINTEASIPQNHFVGRLWLPRIRSYEGTHNQLNI